MRVGGRPGGRGGDDHRLREVEDGRTAAAFRRGREEEVPQGLEAGALEHHRRGGPDGIPGLPGAIGPAGTGRATAYTVRDGNGAVVGQFLGVLLQGFPIYTVLRDGGQFNYLASGEVFSIGTPSPNWKTNDCSGTAYAKPISALGPGSGPRLFGGPYRFIFRTLSGGTFGPTSAWKVRPETETIPATQLYRRNSTTGVCEVDGGPYAGELVPLDAVPAPPDFVGPLTVS